MRNDIACGLFKATCSHKFLPHHKYSYGYKSSSASVRELVNREENKYEIVERRNQSINREKRYFKTEKKSVATEVAIVYLRD